MPQAVDTDLFNPLVPKAHNSECQNLSFTLQIMPASQLKLACGFIFFESSALMG